MSDTVSIRDRCPMGGKHIYKTVHEDWESETRECTKCGDRFTLYDDEMR
jgi:hypothetical protein